MNHTAVDWDEDLPWLGAWILWERLAPANILSMEQMSDLIDNGFEYLAENDSKSACDVWLGVWDAVKYRIKPEFKNLVYLDEQYKGSFFIKNFCQDLQNELYNAGFEDPVYFEKSVEYCKEFCRYFSEILKGSKDKKVLEHGLDQCPVYGYYRGLTLQEITNRVDWMIKKGYLEIEYRDRLPMLVFSEFGWEIERETCAEELLNKLVKLLEGKDYSCVQELKDRNRGMILTLIEIIKLTGNARFIPLLKAWKEIEYKKVQTEIQSVIEYLVKEGTIF